MGRTRKYPEWGNPKPTNQTNEKQTHLMHSLMREYQPKRSEYPRHNSQTTWRPRRRKAAVLEVFSICLRRGIPMGGDLDTKGGAEPYRDCSTWDSSHTHLPNPVTIVTANKGYLTGARYSCLLRGSASAWQRQKLMLTANQWTNHRVPNGGAREL